VNEPQIAAASEADVREMAARRCSNDADHQLYIRLAQEAPRGAWVARDAGTPVAIGFAHALEDEWFLSELFVEPSFRRQGLAGRVLTEVARDAGDVTRAGMLDATNTDAMAFFLKRGVGLRVPVLRVTGEIRKEEELLPMAAGDYRFATLPIDPRGHVTVLATLDREVRGTGRPHDHTAFAQTATGTLLLLNDECVGYVYVWPDGRIGPMVAASAAYLRQFFGFALVTLRRTYGASWCMALVPGSNVRVMRAATRIGLQLDEVRIFATDQSQIHLSRYIGYHPMNF
jgi:GNAT superfamily N-acetyltransferase